LTVVAAYSQQPAKRFDFEQLKKDNAAFLDRVGTPFTPADRWLCEDSTYFDAGATGTPAVIFLGFSGCAPCRFLLHALDEVLPDKRYQQYRFAYVTFDEPATINKEFEDMSLEQEDKVKVITLSKEYIQANNMTRGYPTIFFVNADRTIAAIQTGGSADDKKAAIKWWREQLNNVGM